MNEWVLTVYLTVNYVLNNLYDTDLPWTTDVSETLSSLPGIHLRFGQLLTHFLPELQDYTIAATMNAYWVNFIKTGNPNGGNLTYWPASSAESQTVQRVGNGFEQISIAPASTVELFKDWFATLQNY